MFIFCSVREETLLLRERAPKSNPILSDFALHLSKISSVTRQPGLLRASLSSFAFYTVKRTLFI